jgi:AN1-like Zinc finger
MVEYNQLIVILIVILTVFLSIRSIIKKKPVESKKEKTSLNDRKLDVYSTPSVFRYIDKSETTGKPKNYPKPIDESTLSSKRGIHLCPICKEVAVKKCYYCGKLFCETHRPPEAHKCKNYEN